MAREDPVRPGGLRGMTRSGVAEGLRIRTGGLRAGLPDFRFTAGPVLR